MKLTPEQWMGIIRQFLTFIGGLLVTQGTLSTTLVEQIIGVTMGVVGLIWSIVAKKQVNGVAQGDPVLKLFKRS